MFLELLNKNVATREHERSILFESASPDDGPKVIQHFKALSELLVEVDILAEKLIDESQKDFMIAYSTHMGGVNKQLLELRTATDQSVIDARRKLSVDALIAETNKLKREAITLSKIVGERRSEAIRLRALTEELEEERSFLEHKLEKLNRSEDTRENVCHVDEGGSDLKVSLKAPHSPKQVIQTDHHEGHLLLHISQVEKQLAELGSSVEIQSSAEFALLKELTINKVSGKHQFTRKEKLEIVRRLLLQANDT